MSEFATSGGSVFLASPRPAPEVVDGGRSEPSDTIQGNSRIRVNILKDILDRRFAQYVAAYAAIGWGALQVVDQLVDREVLSDLWYRLALVVFLGGLPASMIISWYHGSRGDQKVMLREVWLLGLVGILTVVSGAWVVRTYEPDDPASVARRLRAAALEGIEETADPRRIAVMYFDARSAGEDVPFLAAGLTETLIEKLDAVEALDVVSRHGVSPYRGEAVPPDSIGRALRVGTIVDGTVAASADQIQVTLEFLNANTGQVITRAIVQRPRTEFFALQDDLAHEAAVFLRSRIGEQLELIEREGGIENVEAWQTLQRARAALDHADQLSAAGDFEAEWEELERADSLLAHAEEAAPQWVDPTIQRGWIDFRRSRWRGAMEQVEAGRWIEEGLEHAQVALQMMPDDAEALELRGKLRYWRYLLDLESDPDEAQRLLERAEADLRKAVAVDPGQAGAWDYLGHLSNAKGDVAQAKMAAMRAYQADAYMREADSILWRLFLASYDLGDRPEAEHWCDELGRRFPDDDRFMECQLWLMTMPGIEPDVDLAWELGDALVELSPAPDQELSRRWSRMAVAAVLARAGLEDSARAVARRNDHNPSVDPTHDLTYLEAFVRALAGDADEAVDLLAEYAAARAAGRSDLDFWWFEELRDEPRYQALLEAAGD